MRQYVKYFIYLVKHRWYLLLECFKAGCLWRGLVHDWSKFRISEFKPYAEHFYGKGSTDEQKRIAFNKAWLLHLKRNPHHWQYWILNNDDGSVEILEMPESYVREMVMDWVAVGRALSVEGESAYGNALNWYEENRDNIRIHPNSEPYLRKVLSHIARLDLYESV